MAEWAGVVHATAQQYSKGAEDQTLRERALLAMMKSKKRIAYNRKGYQFSWQVKFLRDEPVPYGDGGTVQYTRLDRYRRLELPWRGYIKGDQLTEKEFLMNRDELALIKRYEQIIPELMLDISEHLAGEFFIDGNATGNENSMHGFLSFLGNDGNTVAADRVANPSDTYAGKSTALADEGGTWSSSLGTGNFPNATIAKDWPSGNGDSAWDYLSPKLINWSSTSWGTGGTTFEANAQRAPTQGISWARITGGKSGGVDLLLSAENLYTTYKNTLYPMQRIMVDDNNTLRKLGFTDSLNHDGVPMTYDFDVPVNTAFGINTMSIMLECMYGQLIKTRGPIYDPHSHSHLFNAGTFLNLKCNPKAMVYFKNYA